MAILVVTNGYCMINSVDLSDHAFEAAPNFGAVPVNVSAFGGTTDIFLSGLITYGLTIQFNNDFASGKVDATLFPLLGAAATTIAVRFVNATKTSTNPEYSCSMILTGYAPMAKHGDRAVATATFQPAGAPSRLTS